MKEWFALRFGTISLASAIIYCLFNYILNLGFTALKLPVYTWMVISMAWVIGLITVRWQYNNIQPDSEGKKIDFPAFLRQQRHPENPGHAKTLIEKATQTHNPGAVKSNQIREVSTKKNGLGMNAIVEGVVGQSLADAEISMDLEVPEGTKLTVYGQEYTVKKGTVKIRPKRSKSEKLAEMFPERRKRRKKGAS